MYGKTQSILLQVAFKLAATRDIPVAEVKALTHEYYTLLIDLHTVNGIDADDQPKRGGGGGSGGGYASKPKMATPASAVSFTTADGSTWLDYRASKIDGSVKPKFPDFKTADGKESVYEFGLNGEVNPAFAELVTAVETFTSLTDPF